MSKAPLVFDFLLLLLLLSPSVITVIILPITSPTVTGYLLKKNLITGTKSANDFLQ